MRITLFRAVAIIPIALVFTGLILNSQPNVGAAKSPLPTPTVGSSPTPGPDLSKFDLCWRSPWPADLRDHLEFLSN